MTLRLYNTLTRRKEEFAPLDRENVRMYVCGPTVYDYAHIGNARPVIVFDVLFRLLRHLYGAEHVTYVRNITDVDDKINRRAAEEYPDLPLNEAIARVTEKTERQFHADVRTLGCLEPTIEPRATGHIEEMKALIERLIANGSAYVAEDHVLFRVAEARDYGALSRRSLDELIAGARVDVAPYKQDPMDFVLWKPSKAGEPAWPSPGGIRTPGRPGWHIECSAMAWKHLGEVFDIHGGGIDLVFPHHENELTQTRSALGHERMASVWMHNGFLQVEGRKMAKSEGNFVTINELLKTDKFGDRSWAGRILRLAMLKTHYREPIDWSVRLLVEAESNWNRWAQLAASTKWRVGVLDDAFMSALSDDLNTPEAMKRLEELANGTSDEVDHLGACLHFLGLIQSATEQMEALAAISQFNSAYLRSYGGPRATVDELELAFALRSKIDMDAAIDRRNAARAAKNWAESDRIRDELFAMGVTLKDNKDGTTTWELKR